MRSPRSSKKMHTPARSVPRGPAGHTPASLQPRLGPGSGPCGLPSSSTSSLCLGASVLAHATPGAGGAVPPLPPPPLLPVLPLTGRPVESASGTALCKDGPAISLHLRRRFHSTEAAAGKRLLCSLSLSLCPQERRSAVRATRVSFSAASSCHRDAWQLNKWLNQRLDGAGGTAGAGRPAPARRT